MVPRFAGPSDWWEDPSDDSGPETPIYPPGWMVDVATAGDDLLEPSENGTAAPSGDGRTALDDFDEMFLAVLLDLGGRAKRGAIIRRLKDFGVKVKPRSRKIDRSVSKLKDAQLIDSGPSAEGGYWLLPGGQDRARSIALSARSMR